MILNIDVAWRRLAVPDRGGAGDGGGWRPRIPGGREPRRTAMEAPSRGGRVVASSWGPQVGGHCLWYSE